MRRRAGAGPGRAAAYAFARFKFWLSEDIAFTLFVLPLRAAAAGTAAALAVFPGSRLVDTYIGLNLGLSAHRAAADPLDRARLFRGYLARHRERLPHRGPFLARTFFKIAVPLAGPGIAAAGLLSVYLLLETISSSR